MLSDTSSQLAPRVSTIGVPKALAVSVIVLKVLTFCVFNVRVKLLDEGMPVP